MITPFPQQIRRPGTRLAGLRQGGLTGFALALTMAAATPEAARAAGLINVRSFQGTSLSANAALASGNGFIPPDTMGAIGLNQYLETSNGSISVYDRLGALQRRVTMGTFWSAVSPNLSNSLGDQRVLFDHYTNRWIVTGFGATRNVINIAISDSSDALGTWKGVTWTALGAGATADYATLGMDNKGVYIGTNNFNSSSSFTGASVYILSKAELFDGSPSLVGQIFSGSSPFTIQGAVNWQGNPTATANLLFTDLSSPAGSSISRQTISGVGTATPLIGIQQNDAVTFSTSSFVNAEARQPNYPQVIDTLDTRLSANIYQANGKLYGVRTVTPDSSPGVAGTSSALQWFVLDANSGALIESGLIGGDGFDYFQPSIAVNAWGEAVIGYNRSGGSVKGADGNISVFAQAFRTDSLGGLDAWGDSLLLQRSATNGYSLNSNGRFRWGDYSAVSLDPLDSRSFWLIGEYAPASDNWATSISYLQLQPVPGPLPLLGVGSGFLWSRRLRRRIARRQPRPCGGGRSLAAAGASHRPPS